MKVLYKNLLNVVMNVKHILNILEKLKNIIKTIIVIRNKHNEIKAILVFLFQYKKTEWLFHELYFVKEIKLNILVSQTQTAAIVYFELKEQLEKRI